MLKSYRFTQNKRCQIKLNFLGHTETEIMRIIAEKQLTYDFVMLISYKIVR